MKRTMKKIILTTACLMTCMGAATANAADVNVYAEGAFNKSVLDLYIYADVNTNGLKLISNGVKISYNTAALTPPTSADVAAGKVKKGDLWKIGDSSLPDPELNVSSGIGEIIMIGGKLDPNLPLAGLTGKRILIGKAQLKRVNQTTTPVNPAFNIQLSLARGGLYVNFASTDAVNLDINNGVAFTGVTILRYGDADMSGSVNASDANVMKNFILKPATANLWADCDASGSVNASDMNCIRDTILNKR